ncbi:unnamed protein product [Mortierella alpina]
MSTSTATHGPLPKIPEGSGELQLGALIFDDADLLDIMGPMRIFGEESNGLNIKINFISSTLEPIRTEQQVKITPDYTLDNAPNGPVLHSWRLRYPRLRQERGASAQGHGACKGIDLDHVCLHRCWCIG